MAPRSEPKRASSDVLVFVSSKDWTCAECGHEGWHGSFFRLEDAGTICLDCADLGRLDYLPRGDAALTRRAKAGSPLCVVVLKWSRARRRYERQGILADPGAIDRAEEACLADSEVRERRRQRAALHREAEDADFVAELAGAIGSQFPSCPAERRQEIAAHAGQRHSGRIGRTRAGRALDPHAIRLAVIASVRHRDTNYDELLMRGLPRDEAREQVWPVVEQVLLAWTATSG